MSKEKVIKIGYPVNTEFQELMEQINDHFDLLNKLSSQLPDPRELASNKIIDPNDILKKPTKMLRSFERSFTDLLLRATEFRGNPYLKFESAVNTEISYTHFLNFFSQRIDLLENSYYRQIEKHQNVEHFIINHNQSLRAERSLRYGRVSIALGIFGILLGILSSSYNLIQPFNSQSNNQIPEGIIEPELNSSYVDSVKKKPDTSSLDSDTISNH